MNDNLVSGLVLGGALVAMYFMMKDSDRDLPKKEHYKDYASAAVNMDSTENPRFPFRIEPPSHHGPDPLDFTPDLKKDMTRLKTEIGYKTGNTGAVYRIEENARKFAMMVYRRLGRKAGQTSELDRMRAADDLGTIRAEVLNGIQALYITVNRDKKQLILDEISDSIMANTEYYIRAVRKELGNRNAYESGRDFPSGWFENYDNAYDMVAA
ncbi:hypothetical protein TetV_257 [Tetraselmis virus 1]|uniref:Uncharacterized protein n=1 Tax=Tetraselmis virus 1 TaxID=2060617 RepID=A0A2P0VNM2_9VIRU|nr:hypothetical protein QJ968_gp257 [Tetraselmis virus 1]AUF82349.1 hypothetical protein TetV_257 [Tetraselmis virus 1]